MKTEELTGPLLDLWAALTQGWKVDRLKDLQIRKGDTARICGAPDGVRPSDTWSPSTIWSHGGPLFENEGIDVNGNPARASHVKYHAIGDGKHRVRGMSVRVSAYGPTELIARTRCVVACEFGEEVPDRIPAEYFSQYGVATAKVSRTALPWSG